MKKKKAIGVLTTAAIAASTFVSMNPVQAASVSETKQLMEKAENYAGALKWAVSVEGSADGKTRPWKLYNQTKDAYAAAQKAVKGLSGSEKVTLETRLQNNVYLYINRSMNYIDAITAGEKIQAAMVTLKTRIDSGIVDDKTEELYHKLSYEIRKQGVLLDRVYGYQQD
ncbi:surface layer (S-layer) glycoprotein, partial [Bacillus sp. SG-1]